MIDPTRFWRFVQYLDDSDDTCWIWTGAMRDDGRGRFFVDHGEVLAHRAAWEVRNGKPVPSGYRLEQQCGNPQCVRHWELGGPARKLTAEMVFLLRATPKHVRGLAKRYGISRSHLSRIRHWQSWTNPDLVLTGQRTIARGGV